MSVHAKRRARSPYQKYQKVPYRYSEELRNWRDAVIRHDDRAQAQADRDWQRKYGIRLSIIDRVAAQ